MTSRRSPAKAKAAALAGLALIVAGLACGAPLNYSIAGTSGQPGGPYWACATATPVPTEHWIEYLTATPGVTATIVHETTPVPTETPYYRTGEFFVGQGAVVNDLQVTLVKAEEVDGYGVATFRIANKSGTETALTLSQYAFGVDEAGNPVWYSSEGTQALGYPEPGQVEMEPLGPGEEREETLAFAGGLPKQFGFTVNNVVSSAPPPVWFNTSPDPVQCPYGQASWPIPQHGGNAAQKPGSSVLGLTPLGSAKYRLTSPFGCSDWGAGSAGWCDSTLDYDNDGSPDIYLHHGLDLAAPEGLPIYSPLQGIVEFSGWSEVGYGNLLIVRAPIGGREYVWMYFAHQSQPPFKGVGDFVQCGENIGVLGTTGNSTGPHLHWETRMGSLAGTRYGARNVDPDGTRALWEFVCINQEGGAGSVPYLDECRAGGGC